MNLCYNHSVRRKSQEVYLNGKIDVFNSYDDESIYELQFINVDK